MAVVLPFSGKNLGITFGIMYVQNTERPSGFDSTIRGVISVGIYTSLHKNLEKSLTGSSIKGFEQSYYF